MLELIVKPQFKYVRNSLLYCMPKNKHPFQNCLQQKDDQMELKPYEADRYIYFFCEDHLFNYITA